MERLLCASEARIGTATTAKTTQGNLVADGAPIKNDDDAVGDKSVAAPIVVLLNRKLLFGKCYCMSRGG